MDRPYFVFVLLVAAPLVAGLLLLRAYSRFRSEPQNRAGVVVCTIALLTLWAGASWVKMMLDFGTVWGVAHMKSRPTLFPEGGLIWIITACYAVLGWGLVVIARKFPPPQK
jgi:hypothetical protein